MYSGVSTLFSRSMLAAGFRDTPLGRRGTTDPSASAATPGLRLSPLEYYLFSFSRVSEESCGFEEVYANFLPVASITNPCRETWDIPRSWSIGTLEKLSWRRSGRVEEETTGYFFSCCFTRLLDSLIVHGTVLSYLLIAASHSISSEPRLRNGVLPHLFYNAHLTFHLFVTLYPIE